MTSSVATSELNVSIAYVNRFWKRYDRDVRHVPDGHARVPGIRDDGVGLAVAVLLDATIVRAVLLPATMALLGDWNWYLPHWLEWLPRISHEPPATPTHTEHETRIPIGA